MAVIGELATLITAKTKPFTDGLKEASSKASKFSGTLDKTVGGGLRKISGLLTSTTGLIAGLGGAFTFGSLVTRSLQLATAAEDMQTAYATYLKDLGKAKNVLAQLQSYSAATPFEATEIKEAGKQLLAFGFEASRLMEYIKVIGDLSAGSQKPMLDFVDIMGKIKASGVAAMGDINRLADRGVPIFQELANAMGVASSEVRTLVGSGKVGFEEVYAALKNVVSETGLFGGAVDKMAETTSGKLSTLKDNINQAFTEVGTAILQGLDLKALTQQITELVATYKQDIVEVTVSGVKALADGLGILGEVSRQVRQMGNMWSYGYHNSIANYYRSSQWLGGLIGADMSRESLVNLSYHEQQANAALRSGQAIRRQQYLNAPGGLEPGQRGYMAGGRGARQEVAEPVTQTLWDVYREQEMENQRNEAIIMQQLHEQQRTNALLREQQRQMQSGMQPQYVVSHF